MTSIKKTYDLVKREFEGKVDKSGVPYIEHLVGVYRIAAINYQLAEPYLHAALLHDLVEDTEWTLDDLIAANVWSDTTLNAVDYMTVIPPVTARQNILRIVNQDDINIIKLKMCDLEHNSAIHRIVGQPFSLVTRYVETWNILNEELILRSLK